METILFGGTFISQNLAHALKENSFNEIEDYDVQVLTHLSNGIKW
jgi:hypothetical protein